MYVLVYKGGDVLQRMNEISQVKITSYKHDGTVHRIWTDNTILYKTNEQIIGVNDATRVIESDGTEWITKEPGVFYFSKKWWFNVIGLIRGNKVYYYCNLSSPFVYQHETIKYIDYDLDIIVYPDMSYHIVDVPEFHLNQKKMNYPHDLKYILDEAINEIILLIKRQMEPFSVKMTKDWYERFLNISS